MAKQRKTEHVVPSKKEILEQLRRTAKGSSVQYDIIETRAEGAQTDPKDNDFVIIYTVGYDAGKLEIRLKSPRYQRLRLDLLRARMVAPHRENDPERAIRQIIERRLYGRHIPPPGSPKGGHSSKGPIIPPPGIKRKKRK